MIKLLMFWAILVISIYTSCGISSPAYNSLKFEQINDTIVIGGFNNWGEDLNIILNDIGLGGNVFLLPNGKYTSTKPVNIGRNSIQIIGGDSTTLVINHNGNAFELNNANNFRCSNISFESLNIDSSLGSFCFNTNKEKPSKGIYISNCSFSKGLNNVLFLKEGSDNTFFGNNTIVDLLGSDSGNGYGVLCTGCKNGEFVNNIMWGRIGQGRHAFYLSAGASYNLVAENKMFNIEVSAISLAAKSDQLPTKGNILQNNEIRGGSTKYINIGQITMFGNVHNNKLIGNQLYGSSSYGILHNATFGNGNERGSNNEFVRNVIHSTFRSGIYLGGVTDCRLLNNEFDDYSKERRGKYNAITISMDINANYPCERILVEGMDVGIKDKVSVLSTKKKSTNIIIR